MNPNIMWLLIAVALIAMIYVLGSYTEGKYMFGTGLQSTVDPDIVCEGPPVEHDGITCDNTAWEPDR